MDYPEYRYVYSKIKCYKMRIYVNTTTTYRYDPCKNMYCCVKRTCDVNLGFSNYRKCNGMDNFCNPCLIINPMPVELFPNSAEFERSDFPLD